MNFENIKKFFNNELLDVNKFIQKNLHSNIDLIGDIGHYIVAYGGKKIRPIITLLFSKIINSNIKYAVEIASAIELIHTATLLHDDVVDLSEKRRNKLSINKIWGNKEAILVGDFLYTKSFEIMVKLKNLQLLKHMAKTTNIMSEGEVNQLLNKYNFDINENDYFKIIQCKTAQLFGSSSAAAAIINKDENSVIKNTFNYGLNLGIAYQLIDDILDYTSEDEKFGKNIGDDILNGTFTLPLIYIFKNNPKKKQLIKNIILKNNTEKITEIKQIVIDSNALDYTKNIAQKHITKAKLAISTTPNSIYKEMAIHLLDFATKRKF